MACAGYFAFEKGFATCSALVERSSRALVWAHIFATGAQERAAESRAIFGQTLGFALAKGLIRGLTR